MSRIRPSVKLMATTMCAALYVLVYKILYLSQLAGLPAAALLTLVVGLTIWWFVTMLPFVLLVTPPLIRAAAASFPSIVPEDVREHSLSEEASEREFAMSMLVPGLAVVLLGIIITGTGLGTYIANSFGQGTKTLIELTSYLSGGALSIIGLFLIIKKR